MRLVIAILALASMLCGARAEVVTDPVTGAKSCKGTGSGCNIWNSLPGDGLFCGPAYPHTPERLCANPEYQKMLKRLREE